MKLFTLLALFIGSSSFGLPEAEVKASFETKIIPFLKSGEQFTFQTEDGLALSAVHFSNPAGKGTVVFLEGRSEPWLKFGEVFYDLYQQGYSVYAYDHRGQGQSPHLSPYNSEIGHVQNFQQYTDDLNVFVQKIVIPQTVGQKLFLLSHSMGGAIAMDYLSSFPHPFVKAVFSAPMLQINTKPYPEAVALAIVKVENTLRRGARYAISQRDYDLAWAFENNDLTRSEPRFWMSNETFKRNPSTIIGGTSNNWIYESIRATHRIRQASGQVTIPFLLFQAEMDQIVKPMGQQIACQNAGKFCTLEVMPDSQHEILMERDLIRDRAMAETISFFQ